LFKIDPLIVIKKTVEQHPEYTMLRCNLGHLGGVLRVLVDPRQRKMPVHEAQILAHAALDFLHDRIGPAAVGAFEIAILDQRDGGIWRTLDVIARADRQHESAHRDAPAGWDSSSSAARTPSAPGFLPTSDK